MKMNSTPDTAGLCIKGLQWTPSPRVMYVEEWQMAEIVKNCCKPDSASVLSIDTTFNVEQFYNNFLLPQRTRIPSSLANVQESLSMYSTAWKY